MSQSPSKFAANIEESNILAVDPRDIMSQGYGLAPQMLFRDSRISAAAKAIYGYLSSFAGAGSTAYPSKELMCKELGLSRPTFDKHIKALEAYGYVRIHHRRSATGQHLCNIYELVRTPVVSQERMGAWVRACVKATARSREQYRARKEASASEADVLRAAEEVVAAMFGINLVLGDATDDPIDACEKHSPTTFSGDAEVPGSNSFTLAQNARSNPMSNSLTLEEPVLNSSPSPEQNSFTPISNRGTIISQSIPQSDSHVGDAAAKKPSLAVQDDDDGGMESVFSDEEDTTTVDFARLLAASIKPANDDVRRTARKVWDERCVEGYAPSDILAAYGAYKRAYFRDNATVKYAKRIDRWLADSDGLPAYALIAEVGPEGRSSNAREEAVRREVRRRASSQTELSTALAEVDEEYRAMREKALRAHRRVGKSEGDLKVAQLLCDRADSYLVAHGRRARAALTVKVQTEMGVI